MINSFVLNTKRFDADMSGSLMPCQSVEISVRLDPLGMIVWRAR